MKLRWLISLLLLLSAISLLIGVKDIRLIDLIRGEDQAINILWLSRLPRLISILVSGSSLAIAGLIMQQLSRNKFVSPTTAGTMDFARLGILIAIFFFPSSGSLLKMSIAFVTALTGTLLFMKILNSIKFKDTIFIPLVGLMLGNIVSSISTFIAYQYNLVQNISSWLIGDFSLVIKGTYELIFVSVPLLIIAYFFANRFTIAGLGEEISKNLGLNYRQVVNIGLGIVALITASVITAIGVIPFLGLIIPNIVSIYRGDHLKKNLPHTAILGAIFVLACDILGRVIIYPYEIPINLMVGVIGSGIFIYLLLRRQRNGA
mgnify:CR=1 FL=1